MCHVLIIEDEWLLAIVAGDLAKKGGATSVAYAASERAAIAAAHAVKPDVIVSDVRLREGTGPGAVLSIIESLGPIPVIFVTAVPEECGGAPRVSVLNKPMDPTEFLSTFAAVARVG